MRLSQNSICEKNNRCWQPASARSFAVKNGVSRASHFWPQVNNSRESSESASFWRRSGAEHRMKALALLEIDALLAHAVREPMMLIEADAGGERKVRTDAHEHSPPLPVIDVEVVLNDPAICDLQMPSVGFAVADRSHDAGGFPRLEDHHDVVGVRSFEVWIDKVVAAALRGFHNRDVPLCRPSLQPGLKLLGNAPQRIPAHRIKLPICVEEANDALGLLERLNQPIQQDAVKATIVPTNAVLVVLEERVHECPRRPTSAGYPRLLDPLYPPRATGISRAESLAS